MTLKNRLSKLERTKRQVVTEADCICFPPEEPPRLDLQPEIEAAKAVRCPLHGERFLKLAQTIFQVIRLPAHLDRASWNWRSAQCVKAMEASFPPDRWPATEVTEPDGTVRFVLKDGTEIHRLPPPTPVYDYNSGELIGFYEGEPPRLEAISMIASVRRDWGQSV